MPFTPSHAVVALPLVRSPLVPAAIAVGAMTPDLPLFVRILPLHYGRTHDFAWLGATVVLALMLLLVWRAVIRPAVRELSPRWLSARLPEEWDRGARCAVRETLAIVPAAGSARRWKVSGAGAALVLLSLVIGVASHIVWDLFTHEGRWGVVAVPALALKWGPLSGFTWLQHGSSTVGLLVIAVWMLIWLSKRDAEPAAMHVLPGVVRWTWWVSLPIVLFGAWFAGLAFFGPLGDEFTLAHLAYRTLPPACAVWGLGTVVLCVTVQIVRGTRHADRTAGAAV